MGFEEPASISGLDPRSCKVKTHDNVLGPRQAGFATAA